MDSNPGESFASKIRHYTVYSLSLLSYLYMREALRVDLSLLFLNNFRNNRQYWE